MGVSSSGSKSARIVRHASAVRENFLATAGKPEHLAEVRRAVGHAQRGK